MYGPGMTCLNFQSSISPLRISLFPVLTPHGVGWKKAYYKEGKLWLCVDVVITAVASAVRSTHRSGQGIHSL